MTRHYGVTLPFQNPFGNTRYPIKKRIMHKLCMILFLIGYLTTWTPSSLGRSLKWHLGIVTFVTSESSYSSGGCKTGALDLELKIWSVGTYVQMLGSLQKKICKATSSVVNLKQDFMRQHMYCTIPHGFLLKFYLKNYINIEVRYISMNLDTQN